MTPDTQFNPGRRVGARVRAVLMAIVIVLPWGAAADTILLKDGKQIIDCEVVREAPDIVYVRTKSGDMGVPRSEIRRIIKQKTIHDTYKEKRAKVREGDVAGLFKLAMWARENALRAESNQVLKEILASKPEHTRARRLLGHLRIDREWIVPEPLALQLRASGKIEVLERNLTIFLQSRPGLRLATEAEIGLAPLDTCTLDASVSITQSTGVTFYGHHAGGRSLAASVRMRARSEWIGKTPLEATLGGLVSGSAGGDAQEYAINNAFGSSAGILHAYFDRLTHKRLKLLEKEFRRKAARTKRAETDDF